MRHASSSENENAGFAGLGSLVCRCISLETSLLNRSDRTGVFVPTHLITGSFISETRVFLRKIIEFMGPVGPV